MSNWLNVLIPLPHVVKVPAKHVLRVRCTARLQEIFPSYRFEVFVGDPDMGPLALIMDNTISNFNIN